MSTLTINDVLAKTGVTYRQLDYWCRLGLVPDMPTSHGSGRRRDLTLNQTRFVQLLADINAAYPNQLRQIADYLNDHREWRYLLVDDPYIYKCKLPTASLHVVVKVRV